MLLAVTGAIHCGSTPAPSTAADRPSDEAGDESATAAAAAEPATSSSEAEPGLACRPSETEGIPPTTEPVCGADVCLVGEPGGLATCIDTKHKGCTHYLLARVTPAGTTEPLSVYVRCPSGAEEDKPRGGKVEATLMKSYQETGVPALPDESKRPEKACVHVFTIDCPTEI
jgi:hypothetical protein